MPRPTILPEIPPRRSERLKARQEPTELPRKDVIPPIKNPHASGDSEHLKVEGYKQKLHPRAPPCDAKTPQKAQTAQSTVPAVEVRPQPPLQPHPCRLKHSFLRKEVRVTKEGLEHQTVKVTLSSAIRESWRPIMCPLLDNIATALAPLRVWGARFANFIIIEVATRRARTLAQYSTAHPELGLRAAAIHAQKLHPMFDLGDLTVMRSIFMSISVRNSICLHKAAWEGLHGRIYGFLLDFINDVMDNGNVRTGLPPEVPLVPI